VSGGVSNISFSFAATTPCARSHPLRVSVSRHPRRHGHGHCERRSARVYEEIPRDLLELVEDVLLNRRAMPPSACWHFRIGQAARKAEVQEDAWRQGTVEERLKHAW
jgi:5-methyltetrahydrofolate--homocysteine methyltransferase